MNVTVTERTLADCPIKWTFGQLKPQTPHVFTGERDGPCRHCGATLREGAGHWRRA